MTRQVPNAVVPHTPEAAAIRPSVAALFVAFLRLGLTAFGGPAMVAYIRELAVNKKQWLDESCFQNGVALCQAIPGATAIQTAAYVGLRSSGFWGGLAAYLGFGLPAFVLMTALSAIYGQTRDVRPVSAAFHGLQAIVVAVVANATISFGRSSIRDWRDVLITAGAAALLLSRGSPIVGIIAAAGLGLLLYRQAGLEQAQPPRAETAGTSRRPWPALALCLLVLGGLAVLWVLDRRLCELAALMLKVDVFAFGGGFASLPLMLHEIVDARHWLDTRTFVDGIVLGQITPGPIVITATFVGYQVAGFVGALVGTVSVFTPSFVVLVATVPYFDRLQQSPIFRRVERGVLASFVGLLLSTTLRFGMGAAWSLPSVTLAVVAFLALRLKIDILWVILVGAAVSATLL
jgi:chromate transporter